jgi:hypothetical protein
LEQGQLEFACQDSQMKTTLKRADYLRREEMRDVCQADIPHVASYHSSIEVCALDHSKPGKLMIHQLMK